jgi:hypothetical protein
VLHDVLAPPAWANPADVKGSPNVAVTSFRNTQGTFVVWADGHTTRAGSALSYAPGRPIGSPNVAIGSVNLAGVPNVLYADGSLRPPSDTGAQSRFPPSRQLSGSVLIPPLPAATYTWTVIDMPPPPVTLQPVSSGSTSITPGCTVRGASPCRVASRTSWSRYGGEEIESQEPFVEPGVIELTFEPAMDVVPVVTCSPVGEADLSFQGVPMNAPSTASVESVSTTGCRIRFVGEGVSFLAIGD